MLPARCLAWYGYSVWFVHLPSYLSSSVYHADTRLHEAFAILQRMHKLGLQPLDEVRSIVHSCTFSGSLRVSLLSRHGLCIMPVPSILLAAGGAMFSTSLSVCVYACVWSKSLQTGLQSTSSLVLISYGEPL